MDAKDDPPIGDQHAEDGGELQAAAGDQQPPASPRAAGVNAGEAVDPNGGADDDNDRRDAQVQDEPHSSELPSQRGKTTDKVVALFTVVITLATIWQGYLHWQANKLTTVALQRSTEANQHAATNAKAAQASANAAKKALELAEAGEKTAETTAQAAKATADGTKDLAIQAKAANVTAGQIAESTKTGIGLTEDANNVAAVAAHAAERTAQSAKTSLDLTRVTTKLELRAYISVMGTALRYDRQTRSMVATITLQNTGLTPARNVQFARGIDCTQAPLMHPFQGDATPGKAPRAIGPRGRFQVSLRWQLPEWNAALLDSRQWEMWVFGNVSYNDMFDADCSTDFYFTQGLPIRPGQQWELVYAPFGNDMK